MFYRNLSRTVFIALSCAVMTAHAGSELPKPPAPPTQPTPPPGQHQYEGTGRVDQVTRQTGGEIYRLDLARAIPLVRLEAKSKLGRLKIYTTTIVTDKNERLPVRQLSGINVDEPQSAISSEIFTTSSNIAAIEILAEAMGGEAALEIKALSTKEAPKLAMGSRVPNFSCKRNIDALLKDKLEPVQIWVSRAESAAPGSVQERFAGGQLKEQVADFLATMKTAGTYTSNAYLLTLINFFADQYINVRANGVAEPAYRDLVNGAYGTLITAIQNELPCRKYPSESLIKMAQDFNKKYDSLPEASKGRPIYSSMMNKVRDFVPSQFRKEIAAANLTFRQADTEGSNYYKLYISAAEGSFLKNTHRDMSAHAFAIAEQALIQEVKLMDIEQRYQLIVEYQAKYNQNTDFPQTVAARYLNILADPDAINALRALGLM